MTESEATQPSQRRLPWRLIIGVAAVAAIALIVILLLAGGENGDGRQIVVKIDSTGFDPKSLEIAQGDTIVFENIGDEPHWPASNIHPTHRLYPESGSEFCGTERESTSFDSCGAVMPGESYAFTFNFPGVWRFHDHLNPNFAGKVNVLEVEGVALPEVQTGPTEVPERAYDDTIPEQAPVIFQDEAALYSYVRKYGAAKTIQYLNELQEQFGDCHQAAHSTGRYAYELFNETAFQTCSAECHSGCYHGATEAYFRDHGTSNLAEDLAVICSSDLNPFLSHQCFHGVGHGLMAFADYELFEALANCDLLPEGQASCYSGVYMENVVGGLAPTVGHFTDYLSDDPHFPCNVVDEKYKDACYFYQTSRMVQLFDWDFSLVAAACAEIEEQYQRSCFESMGRDVGGVNLTSNVGAIFDCSFSPAGQQRIWCLNGAVQNTFWDPTGQDMAIEFCTMLEDAAEKQGCYDTIFRRAPLVIDARQELVNFCMKSESDFQHVCLEVIGEA
jgi:plastocyanin